MRENLRPAGREWNSQCNRSLGSSETTWAIDHWIPHNPICLSSSHPKLGHGGGSDMSSKVCSLYQPRLGRVLLFKASEKSVPEASIFPVIYFTITTSLKLWNKNLAWFLFKSVRSCWMNQQENWSRRWCSCQKELPETPLWCSDFFMGTIIMFGLQPHPWKTTGLPLSVFCSLFSGISAKLLSC